MTQKGACGTGLSLTTSGSKPIGIDELPRSDSSARCVSFVNEHERQVRVASASRSPIGNRIRLFAFRAKPGSAGESNRALPFHTTYDGEGKRVKKISGTEITIFVYDGGGKLVEEYSTALAQTPQVSYLTTDHLGSPRVITNESGAVTKRQDFSAFGEETVTSQRISGLGYTTDELRQDYTGYQKDDESGLEYAQARYYNTQHGRFTSVDPLAGSATIRNPQSFNRYSYVLNSPYKFSDPLGLLPLTSAGACGNFCRWGSYVDGSAIRGTDTSFEWAKFIEDSASGPASKTPDPDNKNEEAIYQAHPELKPTARDAPSTRYFLPSVSFTPRLGVNETNPRIGYIDEFTPHTYFDYLIGDIIDFSLTINEVVDNNITDNTFCCMNVTVTENIGLSNGRGLENSFESSYTGTKFADILVSGVRGTAQSQEELEQIQAGATPPGRNFEPKERFFTVTVVGSRQTGTFQIGITASKDENGQLRGVWGFTKPWTITDNITGEVIKPVVGPATAPK